MEKDPMSLDYQPVSKEEAVKSLETPAERMTRLEERFGNKTEFTLQPIEQREKNVERMEEKIVKNKINPEQKKIIKPQVNIKTLEHTFNNAKGKLSKEKDEQMVPMWFGVPGSAVGVATVVGMLGAGAPATPLLLMGGLTVTLSYIAGYGVYKVGKAYFEKKKAEKELNSAKTIPDMVIA